MRQRVRKTPIVREKTSEEERRERTRERDNKCGEGGRVREGAIA